MIRIARNVVAPSLMRFFIHLPADTVLPKVKGSDDAKKAFWMPLAELNPAHMFEDHYFITQRMVGQLT